MYATIEGGIAPSGHVKVSGAKNSATRLFAAALLADDEVVLQNFPTELVDVGHKVRFSRELGANVVLDKETEQVNISGREISAGMLSRDQLDIPIRTTYLMAAPQLVRSGRAQVPYPGGCPIGPGVGGGRGYDLHVMVWEQLGCTVVEREDHIELIAPAGLQGGVINFPISTVGGTENALLCASVASGETQIYNAYITPEVQDLIDLLRRMGADIQVHGTSHVHVRGNGGVLGAAHMPVMADRIEALTWIVLAVLSQGHLRIEGVPFDSMEVPLLHLAHAGIDLFRNSDSVYVSPETVAEGRVQPFEIATGAHPGVISDMQAFYVLLALSGAGTSRIFDYRYPERIAFVSELARLVEGDHLEAQRGLITVHGPAKFIAGTAGSTDLRGSMAAVIAALCANGTSVIKDVHMALRGYNKLEDKLTSVGMNIEIFDKRLK